MLEDGESSGIEAVKAGWFRDILVSMAHGLGYVRGQTLIGQFVGILCIPFRGTRTKHKPVRHCRISLIGIDKYDMPMLSVTADK